MYRYLALIWNRTDPGAAELAGRLLQRAGESGGKWQLAMREPGLIVLHDGLGAGCDETRRLHQGSGVVLGRIFSRDLESIEATRRVQFDSAESARVVATGGLRLLERYWGRYVAVIRNADSGEVWVLRDPLGQLPCLFTCWRGVQVVFSDLEDCLGIGLAFSINWGHVAASLADPLLLTRATALNEVSEVQMGERLLFSDGPLQRSLQWRPFDLARADRIVEVHAAERAVRSTTRACVHAWASCYPGIIHTLSGGLDSSIVLSCLTSAPTRPAVTCVNYFGVGPAEDERTYARLVARHLGAELEEHPLDVGAIRLERLALVRRAHRPGYYLYELEHGEYESGLVRKKGASGLFCGAGGDGVFFQSQAGLAVADHLFEHGIGAGLLRTAIDAAQMSGTSIWPLLVRAVQARVGRRRGSLRSLPGKPQRTLLNEDLRRAVLKDSSLQHPWFEWPATRGVPPGILWHVASVAVPPPYYGAFADQPIFERTLPLLSQPLVELCLRMPSYLLIRGGRDRAIARRAFAAELPASIIRRTAKGRIDRHLRDVLDTNLQFVREFLLGGILAARGYLDRRNLERYLTRDCSPADHQYPEILQQYLCTEAWLRRCVPPGLG